MRHGRNARVERALKRFRKFFRRIAHFITAESETADAVAECRNRPIGSDHALVGAQLARNIQRQRHVNAEFALCPRARALNCRELFLKRNAAQFVNGERGIGGFTVLDVLRGLSRQKFARNQFNVVGCFQTFGNGDIDFDEMRKIAKRVPLAQTFKRVVRQCDAIALRQLQKRFGANGTFEMHMQFHFGHRADKRFELRCHVCIKFILLLFRPRYRCLDACRARSNAQCVCPARQFFVRAQY